MSDRPNLAHLVNRFGVGLVELDLLGLEEGPQCLVLNKECSQNNYLEELGDW